MNKNIKKVMVPFILMVIIEIIITCSGIGRSLSEPVMPDTGLLAISGILFGPYGAIGCALGMFLSDCAMGYRPVIYTRFLIPLAISYLSYKLWYNSFESMHIVTKPRLSNTGNVILFLNIILFTGLVFVTLNKQFVYLVYPELVINNTPIGLRYFVNYVNFTFIYGVIGMWLSKRIDFLHVPTKYKKYNEKFYEIIRILLFYSVLIISIIDFFILNIDAVGLILQLIYITTLTVIFLTKPINVEVKEITLNPIPETIISFFLSTALVIIIFGVVMASLPALNEIFSKFISVEITGYAVAIMLEVDFVFIIFFIPSLAILRYVEHKVINPIVSFSKIENIIKKGDKIESKELTDTFADYLDENDEIGMLARSYTDLIEYSNEYIENIRENEIEKERYETELRIAEHIQKSTLPIESIVNRDYTVYGISKPAKEVGGDFYDYYQLDDDNLVIMIGDASGKGVPAALLSTTTQSVIKQIIKRENDPSKVLYLLNNQICEHSEDLTVTVWLGIYNRKTKTLTFSNAGHDSPLINENNEFKFLEMNKNTLLGIEKDYEFTKEEMNIPRSILAYTDGITNALNSKKESYLENRLIDFFNQIPNENDMLNKILKDIQEFRENEEQLDDMTLLYFEIHE